MLLISGHSTAIFVFFWFSAAVMKSTQSMYSTETEEGEERRKAASATASVAISPVQWRTKEWPNAAFPSLIEFRRTNAHRFYFKAFD